jgi:hypothetical protein
MGDGGDGGGDWGDKGGEDKVEKEKSISFCCCWGDCSKEEIGLLLLLFGDREGVVNRGDVAAAAAVVAPRNGDWGCGECGDNFFPFGETVLTGNRAPGDRALGDRALGDRAPGD